MFTLKQVSKSVFQVASGKNKIAQVRVCADGNFTSLWRGITVTGKTAGEVFKEIVAGENRIALCGENNEEKARIALKNRNNQVKEDAKKFNEIADALGSPFKMKVKFGKIRI